MRARQRSTQQQRMLRGYGPGAGTTELKTFAKPVQKDGFAPSKTETVPLSSVRHPLVRYETSALRDGM